MSQLPPRPVPLLNSEQMYQALRSLGIDTQLIIYPGEHHGISRPSFVRDRMERYLTWYDRYLSPRHQSALGIHGLRSGAHISMRQLEQFLQGVSDVIWGWRAGQRRELTGHQSRSCDTGRIFFPVVSYESKQSDDNNRADRQRRGG